MAALSAYAKTRATESSIDLTPMLDVVFILLIFFVVTASFVRESILPIGVQEPAPPVTPEQPLQDILIQLTADNQVNFNGETIYLSAVRARVAAVRAEYPGAALIINPAPGSSAGDLVQIINLARLAGITDVRLKE